MKRSGTTTDSQSDHKDGFHPNQPVPRGEAAASSHSVLLSVFPVLPFSLEKYLVTRIFNQHFEIPIHRNFLFS